MGRVKLPYVEGSVFLVPLPDGGYARGVVARMEPKGQILLGYFFGPRVTDPTAARIDDLDPSSAILRIRFGYLGLKNKEWPIIGVVPKWDRSRWPLPEFIRRDELSGKAWLVRYDDHLNRISPETPTDYNADLPRDSLSGAEAVQIKLRKILTGT